MKRNVAWLALHGGGGSGGSGSGGTVARKASCTILINDTSTTVSIAEGQSLDVTLSNFKGSGTTIPWNVAIKFDNSTIYSASKSQGEFDKITIQVSWSSIRRFFEGSGKTKSHQIEVTAKYNDEETAITGSAALLSYVYIPTIECKITTRDSYNADDPEVNLTAAIEIDSALTGDF